MKVKVKIKDAIARKGCGFYDIDGKQELFPRDKSGAIDISKTFDVEATPFIESKISSGELVLLGREEEDKASSDKEKKDKEKK